LLPGATVLLIAGAAGIVRVTTSAPVRTGLYYSLERSWTTHWPWDHGKSLPRAVMPTLQPFAPTWVQVDPQIRMLLDPNEYVALTILQTGAWEPGSWRIVAGHLQPGATLVDVGAHIGYYSLKAAPLVGRSGHVLAIEPNPETLRILEGNVRASDASAVSIQPVACSDAESKLELFVASSLNSGETSLSRANASQLAPAKNSYMVRARPLDDIIRESGVTRVDAIKIDVEGAEFLVLKGARETLDRFHPAILVELVDHQLKEMGTSTAEVTAFLRDHGYTLKRSDSDVENFEFVFEGKTASAYR
jgi:FkbM family methyltransferase